MMKENYEMACRGENVRENLISLRETIRDPEQKRQFACLVAGDFTNLTALLRHPDAKVRKNAALLLGELESEDVLPALFSAYTAETQLFVRESYVKAMEKLDCSAYRKELVKRRDELQREIDRSQEEARKHLRKEEAALSRLLLRYEHPKRHSFVWDAPSDVILLCSRSQREVTANQIHTGQISFLAGGVQIQGADLTEIFGIRTFTELLFVLHGGRKTGSGAKAAADAVLATDLLELLQKMHDRPQIPFRFRLEYKGSLEGEKRSTFLKKTAALLEEGSDHFLVNQPSDYEAEIRLLESRKGGYVPLLRLFTVQDFRFSYRRQVLPVSVSPVNAAVIMRIAGEYLQENAQVLDPFCGVGTMLIERNYYRSADPLYGVDRMAEAIDKARENSARARMPIHYINRDFFSFSHDHRFDEVVTDLPANADVAFYRTFFAKLPSLLKEEAVLVLYNRAGELLETMCRSCPQIRILKKAVLNERQNSLVIVGQFHP